MYLDAFGAPQFGCFDAFQNSTEQSIRVYIRFPLLLRITRNSIRVCVCVCPSLAILTLNGFCGSFFSPVA